MPAEASSDDNDGAEMIGGGGEVSCNHLSRESISSFAFLNLSRLVGLPFFFGALMSNGNTAPSPTKISRGRLLGFRDREPDSGVMKKILFLRRTDKT